MHTDFGKRKVLFFVGIFALVGIATLALSRADTRTGISFEAESATAAGGLTVGSGEGSGGGFITLGSAVSGELKQWHTVTLQFNGPQTDETATPNPFSDYALTVDFSNGDRHYSVPGYYAADGNAANTSASAGNVWRANFTPDATGTWVYSVSFKTGPDAAINGSGASAGFMDGQSGSFSVVPSDKTGTDNRRRGRLRYAGQHYLQFAGTQDYFIKFGADSPENMLAYDDFDATPNDGGRRKTWSPHGGDYNEGEAQAFTWNGGKGSELLGSVKYLSDQGANAFSFLTFSLDGDDGNVYPHLGKKTDAMNWSDVHHDRFDVSKMDQWDKIFSYADTKGMYLHFKTFETENDNIMDGNSFGRERKLYYRELIARYSHHMALNWNLSEEETLPAEVVKATAEYIRAVDPYDGHIVIHTYPDDHGKYNDFIGSKSELTGASIQTDIGSTHQDLRTWVANSAAAGKKWVVANDEQGPSTVGVNKDPSDQARVRKDVIWGSIMAGGAGAEFYYGYNTSCTDLTCQDHRTRASKWQDAKYAREFFEVYLPFWEMESNDGRTSAGDDYVFEKPGSVYAVYLPAGNATNIDLSGAAGPFDVSWYNPRTGGGLQKGSVSSLAGNQNSSLGNPPAEAGQDWVVLVKK